MSIDVPHGRNQLTHVEVVQSIRRLGKNPFCSVVSRDNELIAVRAIEGHLVCLAYACER